MTAKPVEDCLQAFSELQLDFSFGGKGKPAQLASAKKKRKKLRVPFKGLGIPMVKTITYLGVDVALLRGAQRRKVKERFHRLRLRSAILSSLHRAEAHEQGYPPGVPSETEDIGVV